MKEFKEGYVLQENEYLAKFCVIYAGQPHTGFLAKYTLKGEIPKNFLTWKNYSDGSGPKQIFIHTEEFKSGWKFLVARFGESQNWAVLVHPDNFLIEVYMNDFIELLKTITIINGELQGNFKWKDKKLVKEI